MEKIKKRINECEIEGYLDLSNEERPNFKIKMKGKCDNVNLDNLKGGKNG